MSQVSKGISMETTLFLIFFVLKLTENIRWAWIWVFAPFWVPALILFPFVVYQHAICGIADAIRDRRRLNAQYAAMIASKKKSS